MGELQPSNKTANGKQKHKKQGEIRNTKEIKAMPKTGTFSKNYRGDSKEVLYDDKLAKLEIFDKDEGNNQMLSLAMRWKDEG